MTSVQILIAIVLLQQGFFGLLWLGAAWLRLARRPALHWGATTLLLAIGMALLVERDALGQWTGRLLPYVLNVLAFAIARRGVQIFARLRVTDGVAIRMTSPAADYGQIAWNRTSAPRGAQQYEGMRMKELLTGRGPKVLAAMDEVAARHGATLAQVALAWLMHKPSVTAPIASATSVVQLKDILQSASLALTAEDMKALDEA